jgi:Zn ribbon nucleic-acid-binding protein
MKTMTKEEAIEKAKKVYWISDIIYGKMKKDQQYNQWYGISVPKCLQEFDKMEMIDANTNIFSIREPVDCNYHRSQIIILRAEITKDKILQVFYNGCIN